MAILPVKTYPDPVLKQKAAPVSDFGPKLQKLFDDMIETMYEEDGVGIAAPQVGVSQRIFIACPTIKKGEEYVVVNPEIYESSGRQVGVEGCLSVPGVSGEVARAKVVKFRFQDRHGKPHDMEVKDFFARVVQHEMDHLDGMLFVDRVSFNQRQEIMQDYQRL